MKAKSFSKLIARLVYGDATRTKLLARLDSSEKGKLLKLQLAAMFDMQSIVSTTK